MGLFLGDSQPSKIFVGDTQISKVFLGDTKIRPAGGGGRPISGATYNNKNFYFGSEESANQGSINFNSTGKKMYIIGEGSKKVHQYSLSIARDVSTASLVNEFSTGINVPNDLQFNPSGTKMYILDFINKNVRQHTLSTARDITTAGTATISNLNVGNDPIGMRIGDSGYMLYVYTRSNRTYYGYPLSTARDVTSMSGYTQEFTPGYSFDSVHGISFSPNGRQMFVVHRNNDEILCFALSTARDIETATRDFTISVGSQEGDPMALGFSDDGAYMYASGYNNKRIYMYETS